MSEEKRRPNVPRRNLSSRSNRQGNANMDGSRPKMPSEAGDAGDPGARADRPAPEQEQAEPLENIAESENDGAAAAARLQEFSEPEQRNSDADEQGQPPSHDETDEANESQQSSPREETPTLYEEEEFEELQSTSRDSPHSSARDETSMSNSQIQQPASPSPELDPKEEATATPVSKEQNGDEGATAKSNDKVTSERATTRPLPDKHNMLSNMPTDPDDLFFLKQLRGLLDGKGVPVQVLGQTLLQVPQEERLFTQHRFENLFQRDLLEGLKHVLGPDWVILVETLLENNQRMCLEYSRMPMEVKVRRLHSGLDATNRSFFQILVAASDVDMPVVRRRYKEQYGVDLAIDLQRKCKHPTMKLLKQLVCKDPLSYPPISRTGSASNFPLASTSSTGAKSLKPKGGSATLYAVLQSKQSSTTTVKKATTPCSAAPKKSAGTSNPTPKDSSAVSGLSISKGTGGTSRMPMTLKNTGAKLSIPSTPKGISTTSSILTISKSSGSTSARTPKGPQTKAAPVKKTISATLARATCSRATCSTVGKTTSEKDVTAPKPLPLKKMAPAAKAVCLVPEKKCTGGASSATLKKEPSKKKEAAKKQMGMRHSLKTKKGASVLSIPSLKVASTKKVGGTGAGPAIRSSKSPKDNSARIMAEVGHSLIAARGMKAKRSSLPTKDGKTKLTRPTTAKFRNPPASSDVEEQATGGISSGTDLNISNSNVAGITDDGHFQKGGLQPIQKN